MSMQALDAMARQGGSAEDVLAYLVLARHTKGRGAGAGVWTAAGASAIANKAGMGYRRAEHALEWLAQPKNPDAFEQPDPFIFSAEDARTKLREAVPEHFGASKSNITKIRWYLNPSAEPVALANSLIDGIGAGMEQPPLARIYERVKPDIENGITMAQARLDAVMLLMHLHLHHDIEGCGGVNPASGIHRQWRLADKADWCDGEPVQEVEGSNAAIYEIESADTRVMYKTFAKEALSYVQDDAERVTRFWCAFDNLQQLGFFYEVLTVWSADPADTPAKKKAEYLYPLYIFDRKARDREPFLQREIHTAMLNKEMLDAYSVWNVHRDDSPVLQTGKFRFIAVKKIGAHPVGVYRLRFRPKTRDTGIGMAAEVAKALEWGNAARKIAGRRTMRQWEQPKARGNAPL